MTPQLTMTKRLEIHLKVLELVSSLATPTIRDIYQQKIERTRKCLEERKKKRRA